MIQPDAHIYVGDKASLNGPAGPGSVEWDETSRRWIVRGVLTDGATMYLYDRSPECDLILPDVPVIARESH